MKTKQGKGKVFQDGELFAEVEYHLTIREISSGQEKIIGTIRVNEGGPNFLDANTIFILELESGRKFPIWIKNPHPASIDPEYQVRVAAVSN